MATNALVVRDLEKSYGKTPVLRKLSMTVPMNSIFGLLGPSGCGKTTLLKCILGRLKFTKGSVEVFGRTPGSRGSGIPGPMVGYMPQELALFMEFSLQETLYYFGRIFQMRGSKIAEKKDFLTSFLDLPKDQRALRTFSGGQQRRASLAAALLHEPQLLILDEPTVGVDPLLREAIWNYLTKIVAEAQTTIIITTHYIEEARQAHKVGMLRGGRLLAEAPPDALIKRLKKGSLEEVFLHLCVTDQAPNPDVEGLEDVPLTDDEEFASLHDTQSERSLLIRNFDADSTIVRPSCARSSCTWAFWALLVKNLIKMYRNIPFLLFQFLLPLIQIIIFFGCIGRDPQNLAFGYVNNDTGFGGVNFGKAVVAEISNTTFRLRNFSSHDTAFVAAKNMEIWGFVEMWENFTYDLSRRFRNVEEIDNATLEGGSVHLYLDMTDQQVAVTSQMKIGEAFTGAAVKYMKRFKRNPAIIQEPLKLEEPIFGTRKPAFTDFMSSGMIATIICFMASGLTAMVFVQERQEGLLERSLVAGVNMLEVFLSHVVAQFLVMVVQITLMLFWAFIVFQVPCRGSILLVILLCVLVGLFGMCLGFLISAACEEERTAIQLTLGTAYPNILLNGIIWPIEGMPAWLASIARFFPLTAPVEAVRSVMLRGLDISSVSVWLGLVIGGAWIVFMVLMVSLILHFKKA